MTVVLLAGLYLALDRWSLGDPWISATFAILFVLFGARRRGARAGRPAPRRARRARRGGGSRAPTTSASAARRTLFGGLALLLVVVAIFLMVAKPGAVTRAARRQDSARGGRTPRHGLIEPRTAGSMTSPPETTVAWEGDRASGTVAAARRAGSLPSRSH